MDPNIKLVEMSRRGMRTLISVSISLCIISCLLASLSVAAVRLSALNRPPTYTEGTPLHIPPVLLAIELVLGVILTFITLIAILTRSLKKSTESPEAILKNQRKATFFLLCSALAFALPFRSAAEVIDPDEDLPNFFFVCCADISVAVGSSFLFMYWWWYPYTSQQGEMVSEDPQRKKIPWLSSGACCGYTVLRIGLTFGLEIHAKPLPLQNALALLSIATHGNLEQLNVWDSISIIGLTIYEIVLGAYLFWCFPRVTRELAVSIDISSQQVVIALRYFRISAVIFLVNALFIALISALESSSQPLIALEEVEDLILSSPLGNSAIALAVVAYAVRDFYMHHTWRGGGVWNFIWEKLSDIFRKEKVLKQPNLLYRVADERNPLTEFPVPQEATFSLETATLLFNMCWLVSDYRGTEEKSAEPSDYGRPAFSVSQEIWDKRGEVAALVIESMERIIVAFKPVHVETHRSVYLVPLSSTDLGLSLSGTGMKQEILKTKPFSKLDRKLFKQAKVHAGYEKMYSEIQENLLTELSKIFAERHRPVFFTGHSTGAALTMLCILDLSFREFITQGQLNSIYTFGAPKIMNSAMVQLFQKQVPIRWRCVVSGDSFTVQPISSLFKHPSRVATFTRSGHLALEHHRKFKWWQSQVSVHPMHKLSAYYCALENWHSAYHIQRPIDLWDWPVEKTIKSLFAQQRLISDTRWPLDSALDSPTPDIESRSIRRLDPYIAAADRNNDDIVAFSR